MVFNSYYPHTGEWTKGQAYAAQGLGQHEASVCIALARGPVTHIRVINCLLYPYDVLYLHATSEGSKVLRAVGILIDNRLAGWMICEFENVKNNKQKPPVTNIILDQIWKTTHLSESTGSKEPVGVSCMYVCSKQAE